MSRPEIDEALVIGVLRDYELRLRNVHDEIMAVYRNIIEKKELLETLQTGRASKASGDLHAVLVLSEEKQHEFAMELYTLLKQLQEKEEAIRRVWICYLALPYDLKDILTRLYVQNIKWDAVSMQLSRSTLSKRRNEALHQLYRLYNSAYNNKDILRLGNIGHRYEFKVQEAAGAGQEQLTFDVTDGELNIDKGE